MPAVIVSPWGMSAFAHTCSVAGFHSPPWLTVALRGDDHAGEPGGGQLLQHPKLYITHKVHVDLLLPVHGDRLDMVAGHGLCCRVDIEPERWAQQ